MQGDIPISLAIFGAFNRFNGGLNVVFADFGTAGVNSSTEALLEAYNTGQILPEAQNFGTALIQAGVCPDIAQNAANQLKAYAIAAENYAIAFNSKMDSSEALALWNDETERLILALNCVPNLERRQIKALIETLHKSKLRQFMPMQIKTLILL